MKIKMSVLILAALPSIIILGLFYLLKPNNSEINKELKRLKQENQILEKKNDSIFSVIKNLEQLKSKADEKISQLEAEEVKQEKEVTELNAKINSIKKKYEKANAHSTNFTSADIQRYFTDSLDR
jgi:uncharacterized protein HemX